jgi:hypothetical protein
MRSLWFIVPCSGRVPLTEVCLRQLTRTCETLSQNGLRASAVVIAADDNLAVADDLGFGTIESSAPLGEKVNDGYQLAALHGVDFCVPLGSDDWIDANVLNDLRDDEIRCFREGAMVSEDGHRLARLRVRSPGGLGVRVIPTRLMESCGFRPADDDIGRMVDASVLRGIGRARLAYHDLHPLQLVDWKSDANLNSYKSYLRFKRGDESTAPFEELAGVFPAEALDEMRAVYGVREQVAA